MQVEVCRKCGRIVRIADEMRGQEQMCPHCEYTFTVLTEVAGSAEPPPRKRRPPRRSQSILARCLLALGVLGAAWLAWTLATSWFAVARLQSVTHTHDEVVRSRRGEERARIPLYTATYVFLAASLPYSYVIEQSKDPEPDPNKWIVYKRSDPTSHLTVPRFVMVVVPWLGCGAVGCFLCKLWKVEVFPES